MSDRSEAPTAKRKEDARKEGRVPRSIELNAAVIMLISAVLLNGPGQNIGRAFSSLIKQTIIDLPTADLTEPYLRQIAFQYAAGLAPSLLLILLGLLIAGVAVTLAQTGLLWSNKRFGDFSRLNPLTGFKRIFSVQGLIELLRATLKMAVIGWVAYSFLRSSTEQLISLSQYDLASATTIFFDLGIKLAMRVGQSYLVLAAADYAYQRWDYMRNLRMTKDEIKQEHKSAEGDPYLKGRIRAQMRRMARGRMMANVPKAAVVVTNPTHLAIAIEYHQGMFAPRVLAKGAHHTAFRIVDIAKAHNIPVVQNIPLARAMYKRIEIDQEIPPDLYLAMAEVLAYVYKMKGMASAPAQQTI